MARDDTDKFVHTKRHFGSDDPNIFKKGVYPYEYVTGPEILTETRLPPRDKFYSELNEEGISEEDYDRALETWQHYDCKTMKDYHDHYLTLDVTLMADVFENFRDITRPCSFMDCPRFCMELRVENFESRIRTHNRHRNVFFRKFNSRRYFDHKSPVCQSK